MNRNALNISIFRIGPPKNSLNLVPFIHTKFRLIEISLGRLIFPIFFSLNMVPFIKLVFGLSLHTLPDKLHFCWALCPQPSTLSSFHCSSSRSRPCFRSWSSRSQLPCLVLGSDLRLGIHKEIWECMPIH